MSRKIKWFDDKMEVTMPDVFDEITTEQATKVFGENIPEILYGDVEQEAYISARGTERECTDEDVEKHLSEYYTLYRRIVSGWSNAGIAKKTLDNGKVLGVFHYTSTTATDDYLNYFVLATVEGKEKIITMHCNIRKNVTYPSKFMTILNNMKIS